MFPGYIVLVEIHLEYFGLKIFYFVFAFVSYCLEEKEIAKYLSENSFSVLLLYE